MPKWIYKTGIEGEVNLSVPEIAGKDIAGRIYRDGTEYRPSGETRDGLSDPVGKEFKYLKELGTLTFAYQFGEDEPIDIPYNETQTSISLA